jgi:hypothetical protein
MAQSSKCNPCGFEDFRWCFESGAFPRPVIEPALNRENLVLGRRSKVRAMGAASLLPYRSQTAEPLVPAFNSYWIYIHMSITLTSSTAFAMAGGLGVIREIVSGPRDWTRLDRLQVLTKWLNVTSKAAGAVQLDHGARTG